MKRFIAGGAALELGSGRIFGRVGRAAPLSMIIGAAALLASASAADAAVVTLTFEGLSSDYPYTGSNPVLIQDFYNGGTSSDGTRGPNYGIGFSSNAAGLCLNSISITCSNASRGGLGDPGSQREALFYATGDELIINVPGGFTSLSFLHTNVNIFRTVRIFDDIEGRGTRIGFSSFPQTGSACPGFNAAFCPFSSFAAPFTGVARSVTFRGQANQLALDDITFDLVAMPGAGAVPEPATWATMLIGFGLIGGAMRRRRMAALLA